MTDTQPVLNDPPYAAVDAAARALWARERTRRDPVWDDLSEEDRTIERDRVLPAVAAAASAVREEYQARAETAEAQVRTLEAGLTGLCDGTWLDRRDALMRVDKPLRRTPAGAVEECAREVRALLNAQAQS